MTMAWYLLSVPWSLSRYSLQMDVYMVAADAQQLRAVKEGFERVFADVLIHAVPAAKGS